MSISLSCMDRHTLGCADRFVTAALERKSNGTMSLYRVEVNDRDAGHSYAGNFLTLIVYLKCSWVEGIYATGSPFRRGGTSKMAGSRRLNKEAGRPARRCRQANSAP